MDDEQPKLKVVDRRPFNPDGSPRELSAEEKPDVEVETEAAAPPATERKTETSPPPLQSKEGPRPAEPKSRPAAQPHESEPAHLEGDPLDNPASFLSLIMSLASNAAASLGMMPHPVTGETGIDLKTAKHWIDVLGMLEQKTRGNLDPQEAQVMESLLADLRMQYVSFTSSPQAAKFSATDITGGK